MEITPMTPQQFETNFVMTGTQGVAILARSGCFVLPQIDRAIYREHAACACDDLVLFAKRRSTYKELYGMCDEHLIQPLGIMVRSGSRTRSGRGGHRDRS